MTARSRMSTRDAEALMAPAVAVIAANWSVHAIRVTRVIRAMKGVAALMTAFSFAVTTTPAQAASPEAAANVRLGRPLTPAAAQQTGTTVFPDGQGLPAGRGDVRIGRRVFEQQCARCHGGGGRGGSAVELVGGSVALTSPRPDKTIGLYWPYASTLFDFNRRAMPMDRPGSLTADEAYAVTAYLLFAEGLIGETTEIDARSLPLVKMPNRDGFNWIDVKPARSR